MLGVCLLFVGIVLINNGVCTLLKVEPKAAAVMNLFVGGLSIVINVISLVQGNYYAAGTGLLFGFTYLFVALNQLLHLDTRPFAVFSGFVAVNAVVFGVIEGVTGCTALGISPDWRWAVIWWLYAHSHSHPESTVREWFDPSQTVLSSCHNTGPPQMLMARPAFSIRPK